MSKSKNTATEPQGGDLQKYTNDYVYFSDALRGLQMAFALVSDLQARAKEKIDELTPSPTDIKEVSK